VELLLAYGVLVGAGLSVVFVVAYATVPRWFGRRRGRAGGIASAGLGVGMVLVAPAAAVSIDLVGWRTTYLLISSIVLAALAIAVVLIADDPASVGVDSRDEFVDQPEGHVLAKLGFEVARLIEIRLVFDPTKPAEPIRISGDLADVGTTSTPLGLEKANLDGAIDRRSGSSGVDVEVSNRVFPVARSTRADVCLDRDGGNRLGRYAGPIIERRALLYADNVEYATARTVDATP
jgi:hypothetical protein